MDYDFLAIGAVGVTCVNVGCIPSKHLLAAAHAYRAAGHHPFSGVSTSQGDVDLKALIGSKAEVVGELRAEKYMELAEAHGFDLVHGSAGFVAPDRVAVDGREIRASAFLVATGAAPWEPPIPGLEEAGYLTSTTAMELDELPKSILVIGGNAIGLELGQVFANLGSRVTIVEALDRIAPFEEPEISEAMTDVLRSEGVEVVASAQISRVVGGAPKTMIATVGGAERRFEADQILVATGRRQVLGGLGLEEAGVELDERGRSCSTSNSARRTHTSSPRAT